MSIQTDQWKTTAVLVSFSLVFICRENPRRWGILLFPGCPRFWRLMKTGNRKYPRSSGMDGDKFGESGAFLFSRRVRRRVPDFCDGRRSFLTNEFVLSGTSAMSFAHYQSPKLLGSSPLSHITWRIWDRLVAIIWFIGKIWDGQQKVKPSIVWDFPDIWNFAKFAISSILYW